MALDSHGDAERVNAIVGWALTAIVVLGAVTSLLGDQLLWGGFVLLVAIVIALPPAATREWRAMVPWPVPAFTALAVILRVIGEYHEIASYVAAASLALLVVVELDVFTRVEVSRRFAVVFAVLTTMAVQALWTVAQFYSDRWLETTFLRSQTELQWDFVFVTLVGLVVGGLFQWYAARYELVNSFERRSTGEGE